MTPKAKGIIGLMLCGIVLVFFTHSVLKVWETPGENQWDFRVYYFAGAAFSQGTNPYSLADLSEAAQAKLELRFTYAPMTLELFRTFSCFEYSHAHRFWLLAKLLALGLLIWLWKRFFLEQVSYCLIIPVALLAFGATVFWDIKAGNISIFEHACIWLSFAALLRRKTALFVILILAASIFKIFPIALLSLLLLTQERRKGWLIGAGLTLFLLLFAIDYLAHPALFQSYIGNLSAIDERAGGYNFSMLALCRDLFGFVPGLADRSVQKYLAVGTYVAAVSSIVGITIAALRKRGRWGWSNEFIFNLMFACCAYALIVPRLKCYSFILVIPACLYQLTQFKLREYGGFLLVCAIIPSTTPFFEADTINYLFKYWPLLLTSMVWAGFVFVSMRREQVPSIEPDSESSAAQPAIPKPRAVVSAGLFDRTDNYITRVELRLGPYGTAGVIALVLLLAAAIYVRPEGNYTQAGVWYEQMTNNPFDFSQNNAMGYRILTPMISYIIGLRGKLFMVTNAFIALIFIGFVYRHFRKLYSRPADAFFAAAILTFSSVVLVMIGYSGFCDILTYAAIFAMWHWRKNIYLYSLFFAVGVFNHEGMLFLLPWLIAIRCTEKKHFVSDLIQTVVGLAIVLTFYLFFRQWVVSQREVSLSLSFYLQPLLDDPLHWMRTPVQFYGLGLFTVFKALWIIPVAAGYLLWKEGRRRELWLMVLPIILASVQLVIAYDSTRMFTLGFMTMVLALEYLFATREFEFRRWLPGLFIINLFIPQLYTAANIIQIMRSTPMNLLRMWLEHMPWWP